MMPVDHTQASQGFSGGLSVGIWEAKASGGDEPEVHVRVAGAFSHEPLGWTDDPFSSSGHYPPLLDLTSQHGLHQGVIDLSLRYNRGISHHDLVPSPWPPVALSSPDD